MTERPAVLHLNTDPACFSSVDSNSDPFESPIAYYSDQSTTSLPTRPHRAVLPTVSQHRYMDGRQPRSDGRVEQDEILQEKRVHSRQQSMSDRASRYTQDPEKQIYISPRNSRPHIHSNDALSIVQSTNSLNEIDALQAQKAVNILLYLSGPCVLLSFITMIWALISLLVTILYQPLRLCTPKLPFRHQMCHLLAPTLNLHVRCIYAAVYPRPVEQDGVYSAAGLMAVHMVAPVVSISIAVAAWVVALYWCLARIVGDPAGNDRKDDGVEAVLGLTHFWEGLLTRSIRVQDA